MERNDNNTSKKLCQKCLEKINDIALYRQICAATNFQLKLLQSERTHETTVDMIDAETDAVSPSRDSQFERYSKNLKSQGLQSNMTHH